MLGVVHWWLGSSMTAQSVQLQTLGGTREETINCIEAAFEC